MTDAVLGLRAVPGPGGHRGRGPSRPEQEQAPCPVGTGSAAPQRRPVQPAAQLSTGPAETRSCLLSKGHAVSCLDALQNCVQMSDAACWFSCVRSCAPAPQPAGLPGGAAVGDRLAGRRQTPQ